MNIARKLCVINHGYVSRNLCRKFRISALNYDATSSPPQVQEEKYDFEDLKVLERTFRRKPKIQPFVKNMFVSVFDRELLAYPEVINKEETENVERRVDALNKVFLDSEKSQNDKIDILKKTNMYATPVSLTRNGLAATNTEMLLYLDAIADDFQLGQELSDHWVGLLALQQGLPSEQFAMIIDDLITGDKLISLGIKEKISERLTQSDFRTVADLDEQGIWRITGEKVCEYKSGYILVLCSMEASRLRAFLVHPNAHGVSANEGFVQFNHTPGTPLDQMSEQDLANTLGISRLHAATLCRGRLIKAVNTVVDYVRPRVFSGKPLSELSTLRACIGNTLLKIYASESSEYFTAGLLDGYEEPDAELEMAMCRNFMTNHGLTSMLRLLEIPALDKEAECKQLLDEMRHLATRGETLDGINMFIALCGIHHAGKMMCQEVKQIRNPLFHPAFIFKKIIADRHQERDDPKLTLFLAEHLHPSLKSPAEQLEYCVLRMKYACETLMARHGQDIATAYTELSRLAEAATEIYVMSTVLARASRSYCIGLRNASEEMKLSACFVEKSRNIVRQLIKEINDGEYLNLDKFTVEFGKKVIDNRSMLVEKPTAHTFW